MWRIGDIVESKITGKKIKITRLCHGFIVGKLIDFVPYPPSSPKKLYDGTAILSHKNIKV